MFFCGIFERGQQRCEQLMGPRAGGDRLFPPSERPRLSPEVLSPSASGHQKMESIDEPLPCALVEKMVARGWGRKIVLTDLNPK